jgi:hypothetical protein
LQIPEEVPSDSSGDDRESVDFLLNTRNNNAIKLPYKLLHFFIYIPDSYEKLLRNYLISQLKDFSL